MGTGEGNMQTTTQPIGDRRARPMNAVILLLTIGGLVLAAIASYKAFPPLSFGTGEEHESIHAGRRLIPLAAAAMLAPAILLAARGHWIAAAFVALPGCGAVACAIALPDAFFGFVLYLVLAPLALGAVIVTITRTGA